MQYHQPKFNQAPSFNFAGKPPRVDPIVEPCAGGCGEPNPCFGISSPGPMPTDRLFYCRPCWLLQPSTQSFMVLRLREALQED